MSSGDRVSVRAKQSSGTLLVKASDCDRSSKAGLHPLS